MKTSKSAYSMIELVFVLVIIGVVAAVGIPKLAVTRNDASASVIATQLGNCIILAGKGYLEYDEFDINDSNCISVTRIHDCYTLSADDENGTLTVQDVADTTNICKTAQVLTAKNNLASSSGIIHSF